MGNLSDALVAQQAGLNPITTLADTDLITIYNTDGTPKGKIAKSDLMSVVKSALPALLTDQGTNGVKFPSLNSSNVLGSMTAANLASVLGVSRIQTSEGTLSFGTAEITTAYAGILFIKPQGSGQIGIYAYNGWNVTPLLEATSCSAAHGSAMNKISITLADSTSSGNYFLIGTNLNF